MNEPIDETSWAEARRIVTAARHLVVLSGAGMSAECGIPTFRSAVSRGWDADAQRLASPEGFRDDPQRVWSWYLDRRRAALKAEPHAGYGALVDWEQRAQVTIITQNVDGLHARAGSSQVVELHGSLHRFFCAEQQHAVNGIGDLDEVPRCLRCGTNVRPAVVWFGEWIPEQARQAAAEAMLSVEAILLVGTSLVVSTPAGYLRSTQRRRIPIVEVNPEPALPRREDLAAPEPLLDDRGLPPATVVLAGSAGTVLPRLMRLDDER